MTSTSVPPSERPRAFSYLRFSTPEQAKGDSTRRQSEMAQTYAARRGLALDRGLTFRDLGVSGFRGSNVRQGALGQFLRAVDEGLVPAGSFLLVESLDRVSRQNPWDALPIFQQIINAGVTIVTLQDERIWSKEEMQANPFRMFESLLVMIRAHEESATKSKRLKASWVHKRSQAESRPLTGRAPAWLRLGPDRTWEVLEERAAIVRGIFEMAASGLGQHAIAAKLNQDGVAPFGTAQHWHRSYVLKVLRNAAVIGTFIPHTLEHEEGGRKLRKPEAPVASYFPAVVSEELFSRVQAMTEGSQVPQRGRHAAQETRNVLGGLARCPLCAGSMTRVTKGAGAKAGRPYLVCAKAKAGAGCTYRAVSLDLIEEALVRGAEEIGHGAPAASGETDVRAAIDEKQALISELEDRLAALLETAETAPSASVGRRIQEMEADLLAVREQETALWLAYSVAQGAFVTRRVADLITVLGESPLSPARVNAVLRQTMRSVTVNYPAGTLDFDWLHGGSSRRLYAWPEADAA